MKILAIESSCDETAAAVVKDGVTVLSNVVSTSHEMHEKYGGIVPEVAARKQLEYILPVITEALSIYSSSDPGATPGESRSTNNNTTRDNASSKSRLPLTPSLDEEGGLYDGSSRLRDAPDGASPRSNNIKEIIESHIDAIAVTVGPGLIGSLLIGVETAKTIAAVTGKPIIPVNHVLAHMYANFIQNGYMATWSDGYRNNAPSNHITIQPSNHVSISFPAISLVVSGGHTELYLMTSPKDLTWLGGTLDDAAGECFDKAARLLGFGHGGGLDIQKAARKFTVHGSRFTVKLPRPMLDKENELNFSFSGLKTAILREVNVLKANGRFNDSTIQQLAFEVQEAITDVLVKKTIRAAEQHNARSILLSGGVAANTRLREKFGIQHSAFSFHVPPVNLCTDNAAYIGSYAYFRGKEEAWESLTAIPDLPAE